MQARHLALAANFLAVCLFAGCAPSEPTPVKAIGKVTLDGKPVDGANVTLIPQGAGKTANATTDASGVVKLKTNNIDGALPGNYKVTVSKMKAMDIGQAAPGTDPTKMYLKAMEKHGKNGQIDQSSLHQLPIKYSDLMQSGLTLDVPAAGIENFTLELRSK